MDGSDLSRISQGWEQNRMFKGSRHSDSPRLNYLQAVADSTVRVVGGQDQQTLPQSESSSGYADPDGVLAGIVQPQEQINNVTGIQVRLSKLGPCRNNQTINNFL
jgi:hypothetical protein